VQAVVGPLLERAGLVAAIDEAWAMIAALALVGVLLMALSVLAPRIQLHAGRRVAKPH
jgi:hypothetical protein